MSLLFIIAFFWTMRLYEYLITTDLRITTNVCIKDAEFINFRGGIINQRSEAIFSVVAVRITFREQKNKEK